MIVFVNIRLLQIVKNRKSSRVRLFREYANLYHTRELIARDQLTDFEKLFENDEHCNKYNGQ